MNKYNRKQVRAALEAIYAAEIAYKEARAACQKAEIEHKEAIAALCDLTAAEEAANS